MKGKAARNSMAKQAHAAGLEKAIALAKAKKAAAAKAATVGDDEVTADRAAKGPEANPAFAKSPGATTPIASMNASNDQSEDEAADAKVVMGVETEDMVGETEEDIHNLMRKLGEDKVSSSDEVGVFGERPMPSDDSMVEASDVEDLIEKRKSTKADAKAPVKKAAGTKKPVAAKGAQSKAKPGQFAAKPKTKVQEVKKQPGKKPLAGADCARDTKASAKGKMHAAGKNVKAAPNKAVEPKAKVVPVPKANKDKPVPSAQAAAKKQPGAKAGPAQAEPKAGKKAATTPAVKEARTTANPVGEKAKARSKSSTATAGAKEASAKARGAAPTGKGEAARKAPRKSAVPKAPTSVKKDPAAAKTPKTKFNAQPRKAGGAKGSQKRQ